MHGAAAREGTRTMEAAGSEGLRLRIFALFLALLDDLIPHGMATLSPVRIVKYSPGAPA